MLATLAVTACQREATESDEAVPVEAAPPPPNAAPAPPVDPIAAPSPPTAFDCGGTAVTVGFEGDQATVVVDGEAIPLATVPTASGARYQGIRADGVPVEVWSKGEQLTLLVAGNAYPECTRPAASVGPTASTADGGRYTARGNEPFWSIEVEGGTLHWKTPESPDAVIWGSATRTLRDDGFDITASRDEATLVMSATGVLCRDGMSGMPYPHTVTVRVDSDELQGCGGEPQALLMPGEWTVASIDGKAIDGSPPTLQFMADGGAGGFSGCNRWRAATALSGEGLAFERPASTLMACPEAAMAVEQAFLSALAKINRHDFDATGRLVLLAGDTPVITAARTAADAGPPEG